MVERQVSRLSSRRVVAGVDEGGGGWVGGGGNGNGSGDGDYKLAGLVKHSRNQSG